MPGPTASDNEQVPKRRKVETGIADKDSDKGIESGAKQEPRGLGQDAARSVEAGVNEGSTAGKGDKEPESVGDGGASLGDKATAESEKDAGSQPAAQNKRQRKDRIFEGGWKHKRKAQRERKKVRKLQARQEADKIRAELLASGVTEEELNARDKAKRGPPRLNRKAQRARCSARCKGAPSVVMDLSFEDRMVRKEIISLAQQVRFASGVNSKAEHPLRLVLSSFTDDSLVSQQLHKDNGFPMWVLSKHATHFKEQIPQDKVVYLAAESDNVLEGLERDQHYVIGGIVDHNRMKGLVHGLAAETGLRTARLPIDRYMHQGTRAVITVNQVFEILLAVWQRQSRNVSYPDEVNPCQQAKATADPQTETDATVDPATSPAADGTSDGTETTTAEVNATPIHPPTDKPTDRTLDTRTATDTKSATGVTPDGADLSTATAAPEAPLCSLSGQDWVDIFKEVLPGRWRWKEQASDDPAELPQAATAKDDAASNTKPPTQ